MTPAKYIPILTAGQIETLNLSNKPNLVMYAENIIRKAQAETLRDAADRCDGEFHKPKSEWFGPRVTRDGLLEMADAIERGEA